MYILVTYVPESHLEKVKDALFSVGCGCMGGYDSCCWQTEGTGQFRPLVGSDPFIGKRGELEYVKEYRIELALEDELVEAAREALLEAHPYEVPAYHFLHCSTNNQQECSIFCKMEVNCESLKE